MKNLISNIKTLLFSVFMAVVVYVAGNTVSPIEDMMENSISTCCEEYSDLSDSDNGH